MLRFKELLLFSLLSFFSFFFPPRVCFQTCRKALISPSSVLLLLFCSQSIPLLVLNTVAVRREALGGCEQQDSITALAAAPGELRWL